MRPGLDLLYLIPHETGGRETYARQLISAMLEIEPTLAATAFVNREARTELGRAFGTNLTLVTAPVSARSPVQWATGELAWLPIAAAHARVDVLHSLANLAPVAGGFPRVVTIHDLQYRAVPELLTWKRRIGTSALVGLAARRATRIIAVSAYTAEALVTELGVSSERIDVIHNGVTAPATAAVGEGELRDRLGLGGRTVALTVSTALPHKNLEALVDALSLIPADRRPLLVITGAGTDSGMLRHRASSAGVQTDVRLLGFQSAEVLEGLYRLAACVVLPSLYEGFGLPVLEAMVHGVPVACSDIPALREVAGDAALRFSPRRTPDIAAAIMRLLEDRSVAQRLVAAGRTRAAEFSWRRAADATLATYRRALEASSRATR